LGSVLEKSCRRWGWYEW